MKLKDLITSISSGRARVEDFHGGKIYGFHGIDGSCDLYRITYIDTKETGDFAYDWQIKQPMETELVACGIIAYYLRFQYLDVKKVFENYHDYNWGLYEFEKNNDKQANFDFLVKSKEEQMADFHFWHISQEKQNAETSKALYPFLEPSDTEFLDKLVRHYLKWLGEQVGDYLPTTAMLESIFKNHHLVLQKFLQRIKSKKGSKIVDEVVALDELGFIDSEEKGEPLRRELEILGYDTTTKQNWCTALRNERDRSKIIRIKSVYKQS